MNDEEGTPPATPDAAPLPDALAQAVARAYSELLREPVPDRLARLMEAIRRFEAHRRKPD
jgi:hypothetical protein